MKAYLSKLLRQKSLAFRFCRCSCLEVWNIVCRWWIIIFNSFQSSNTFISNVQIFMFWFLHEKDEKLSWWRIKKIDLHICLNFGYFYYNWIGWYKVLFPFIYTYQQSYSIENKLYLSKFGVNIKLLFSQIVFKFSYPLRSMLISF